jgi:hypothetical protein
MFYFVNRSHQNSNLIRIQIGLKFRKDLKNKKPFSYFPAAVGRNLLPDPARCRIPDMCVVHIATRGFSTMRHASQLPWPDLLLRLDGPVRHFLSTCSTLAQWQLPPRVAWPTHIATFIPVESHRRVSSMEVLS